MFKFRRISKILEICNQGYPRKLQSRSPRIHISKQLDRFAQILSIKNGCGSPLERAQKGNFRYVVSERSDFTLVGIIVVHQNHHLSHACKEPNLPLRYRAFTVITNFTVNCKKNLLPLEVSLVKLVDENRPWPRVSVKGLFLQFCPGTALPPASLHPHQQTPQEKEQYPLHYRGVKDLVDNGSRTLPQIYIKTPDQRPVIDSHEQQIPLIDLSELEGAGRSATVEAIGQACRDWGFFLVKNHGVSESTMEKEMRVGREFFHLTTEEKMRYFSTDPKSRMRYATSFNVKEDKTLNWRDFIRYSCKPLEEMVPLWPDKPTDFRKANAEYSTQIGVLARILLSAISESLGLPSEYINDVYGDYSQYMAYNFYPACPSPEQTLGLPGHSDPGGLTLLMQDEVGGLQVLHEGRWVVLRPVPNTLVINLGDQLQILSNDIYKSVEHRAVVNTNKERISVATAYGPSWSTVIAPAPQLVNSSRPAVYKGCVYGDFMDALESGSLHKKSVLDCLRIDMK